MPELPYREFYYPLNVFMHILTREEGDFPYLHYGLFERPDERIAVAQERSTALLLSHLPHPPARVLDVGIGLGTTLRRLTELGYEAVGITPDDKQIAMARQRHGDTIRVQQTRFEDFANGSFDVVVFQESSQYIEARALFAKARELTRDIVVLDEFSTGGGTLHRLSDFLAAANEYGFVVVEQIDVSANAAPTVDYFMQRLDRYRSALRSDLALTNEQVDELVDSGAKYRQLYADGTYVYQLLRFTKR